MNFFIKTLDGATASVDINSIDDLRNIRSLAAAKGLIVGGNAPMIISENQFKSALLKDAPPIPKPQNANDVPPQNSTTSLIASNSSQPLLYHVVQTNGNDMGYMSQQTIQNFINQPSIVEGKSISPALPAYTLEYNCHWRQADYQRITGPQSFQYTATTTEGMSQTDQSSWSASLGVSVGNLSASLSEDFSQSVTISDSNTVQHQYNITVPDGKIGIWILWQMVFTVVAVDPSSGNQISYSGMMNVEYEPFANVNLTSTLATQAASTYAPDLTPFDA